MKANYISRSEAIKLAKKEAKSEVEKMYNDAYQNAVKDVIEQNMAVHIYLLHTVFGFGEKRIKKFLDECNHINDLMDDKGAFLGKEVSPDNLKDYIEEKFGVNITLNEVVIKDRKKGIEHRF